MGYMIYVDITSRTKRDENIYVVVIFSLIDINIT